MCQALAAVHGRGLVHRDIKAQNVMREEGGRTVLMDFGAGTELATGLRKPLDMAGTPLYLAPELFDGQPATRASDIYSLGVLLYRMVTREYPVEGAISRRSNARIATDESSGCATPGRISRATSSARSSARCPRILRRDRNGWRARGGPRAACELRRCQSGPRGSASRPAAAVVLVAVPVALFLATLTKRPDSNSPSPAAAVERTAITPAAAVSPSYTVQASMFRTRYGVETPLTAGTELALGDMVSLRVEASKEVYVYVLNTDDAGKTFRLFPLADHQPDNPLAPSKEHRLPGEVGTNWSVSSAGGREHFVIMVNPVRVDAVEAFVRSILVPRKAAQGQRSPTRDIGELRAVGGLTKDKTIATAGAPALLWFEEASEPTGQRETVSGPWMRRLTVPPSR